jgi:hypothetical protein
MIPRFVSSAVEQVAIIETLKKTPCPHCKKIGALIRHGYLRGYDESDTRNRCVRAHRFFCNNRKARHNGCGRTFSVWAAEKIRRLYLQAGSLWKFLQGVADRLSIIEAFRSLRCPLAERTGYRIWKRFEKAQSFLRTVLASRCPPPGIPSVEGDALPSKQARPELAPLIQVLAHLESAFSNDACPIRAFQRATQSFFLS